MNNFVFLSVFAPAFELLEKLFEPPAFKLEMPFLSPKQTKQYRCRNIVSYS
jgi:hypothetical protein